MTRATGKRRARRATGGRTRMPPPRPPGRVPLPPGMARPRRPAGRRAWHPPLHVHRVRVSTSHSTAASPTPRGGRAPPRWRGGRRYRPRAGRRSAGRWRPGWRRGPGGKREGGLVSAPTLSPLNHPSLLLSHQHVAGKHGRQVGLGRGRSQPGARPVEDGPRVAVKHAPSRAVGHVRPVGAGGGAAVGDEVGHVFGWQGWGVGPRWNEVELWGRREE